MCNNCTHDFFFHLVWNLESRKSLRTFKHRHPITAVAMSEKLCLSGCEAGRVKVWDLKTGKLIKVTL